MLFDSHSHLHDKKFDEDRDAAIERAREAGVTRILTLGDTLGASRKAIALAEAVPEVLAAAGIHPGSANSWDDEAGAELEQLLAHPKAVVLGEIGLDYYWDKDPAVHAKQQEAFREQLRMARRLKLPVSIHSRESNGDVLRILREEHGAEIGGVLHCFQGSVEEMREGVELGFAIGVGGVITYPKSEELRAAVKALGPEHILLETDAPYLPPQPRRGRRNEPAYVAMTADVVAELFGMPRAELARMTTLNTERAFRLKG
jgi:TatD DNase family protein